MSAGAPMSLTLRKSSSDLPWELCFRKEARNVSSAEKSILFAPKKGKKEDECIGLFWSLVGELLSDKDLRHLNVACVNLCVLTGSVSAARKGIFQEEARLQIFWPAFRAGLVSNQIQFETEAVRAFTEHAAPSGKQIQQWFSQAEVKARVAKFFLHLVVNNTTLDCTPQVLDCFENVIIIDLKNNPRLENIDSVLRLQPPLLIELFNTKVGASTIPAYLRNVVKFDNGNGQERQKALEFVAKTREQLFNPAKKTIPGGISSQQSSYYPSFGPLAQQPSSPNFVPGKGVSVSFLILGSSSGPGSPLKRGSSQFPRPLLSAKTHLGLSSPGKGASPASKTADGAFDATVGIGSVSPKKNSPEGSRAIAGSLTATAALSLAPPSPTRVSPDNTVPAMDSAAPKQAPVPSSPAKKSPDVRPRTGTVASGPAAPAKDTDKTKETAAKYASTTAERAKPKTGVAEPKELGGNTESQTCVIL